MQSLDEVDVYFAEFYKVTTQLTKLVPSLEGSIFSSVCSQPSEEEVFLGLPTLRNSQAMFDSLANCCPSNPTKFTLDSSKFTARFYLSRMELVATVASVFELHTVEGAAWQAIESLARQSARVIDETYALINRAYIKVRVAEATCYANTEELSRKISRVQTALKSRAALLSAYEELVLTVKLPTQHAQLQCVVIDAFRVYFENYFDWDAIDSRLNLVVLRHKEFLGGKVWAAVYCNGFIRWLRLRARCSTGAPPPTLDIDSNDVNFTHPLYEATHVKAHGQTLVKFMKNQCDRKAEEAAAASKAKSSTSVRDKENIEPNQDETVLGKHRAWMSPADLANLWLATRLHMYGTQQLAELYTLLGTTKEARVYQLELLRAAQRIHNPSCAQTAVCLMAYTDMVSQRKWSFDSRLRQLQYILTSKVLLKDVVVASSRRQTTQQPPTSADDDDSSAFLKQRPPKTAQENNKNLDDSSPDEYVGMATNPLIDAAAGGTAGIFPTSPLKTADSKSIQAVSTGYPSMEDLTRTIIADNEKNPPIEGTLSAPECAYRVLNGGKWSWLGEIGDLIRFKVVGRDHLFEALIPPASPPSTEPIHDYTPPNGVAESPPDLPDEFDKKCSLATPGATVTSVSGAIGTTKAARAAAASSSKFRKTPRRRCETTSPTPLPSNIWAAPSAPRRLAAVLRAQEKKEEESAAASRSQTRRAAAIAARDKSAPVLPTSRRGTSETPAAVRRASRTSNPAARDIVDTKTSEVAPSLFGYTGTKSGSSGYTFGSASTSNATARRCRLSIHQDGTGQKLSNMPSLCLFKAPNPLPQLRHTSKAESNQENEGETEPAESCPSLSQKTPRPRNLRLASRWAAQQLRAAHRIASPPADFLRRGESDLPLPAPEVLRAQEALADRLYGAYKTLAGLPVPHMMRPVCQWLGLRWLAMGNQEQAGRFFSQAVGLCASNLHAAMLCSKANNARYADDSLIKKSLSTISSLVAPNDAPRFLEHLPLSNNGTSPMQLTRFPLAVVIQLTLVDELGAVMTESDFAEYIKDGVESSRHLVPWGLGSHDRAHLVTTRWVIRGSSRDITDASSCGVCETRVMHNFFFGGLQSLDAFSEIQTANVDSMQAADRERFWTRRFSLDDKLRKMVQELRDQWFSKDDISWLHGLDLYDNSSENSPKCPFVLILDRRLVYLPWEWIIYSPPDPVDIDLQHIPPVCRNFSFASVIGQLVSLTSISQPIAEFDPQSTFYVLNPEANLPSTEATFSEYIRQHFERWTGVIHRRPDAQEVIRGFTKHDLFVYMGHGNGSRFLMSTFDEGLVARAVALIIGCSSAKPRLEGRCEAFASIFNHIIAGCPTVLGLLWDVTDKDIDRFTASLLSRWLKETSSRVPTEKLFTEPTDSITWQIFRAVEACKLKSLVGKSVITYGLPAVPRHKPR